MFHPVRPDGSIRASDSSPRPGLTLMEVLVSIFIMAIGMLALLTLFPLGALRMEQAIRDERCAQAGIQAKEYARILDLSNDPAVRAAMVDPNAPAPGTISTVGGPSKAVLVDPLGTSQFLDATTQNLARVQSNYASNYYEFFTLTDDLVFQGGAGIPRVFGTSTVGREIRFSWSYLLQQPQVQNPGITNYSICVYNRRPLAGTLEFTLPSPTINISDSYITFTVTDPSTIKQILPGQWVLDATLAAGPGAAVGLTGKIYPMANFYRIVNVRQGSTATQTVLELQTPIRGYQNNAQLANDPITGKQTYTGTGVNAPVFIIQDSLVEVIEVGPLR